MASSKIEEEQQHPMVDVPDAIRMVLETTSKILLENLDNGGGSRNGSTADNNDNHELLPSNAPASQLIGRILADDVLMSEPGYPPYRASIMDGYAIQSKVYLAAAAAATTISDDQTKFTHQVSGRRHAGPSSSDAPVPTNCNKDSKLMSAVYVTTGARIPDSYDCVVPIELIHESDDQSQIKIDATAAVDQKHDQWIRQVGCDIQAGSIVLPRGLRMNPVALGLLQQSGQPHVKLVSPTRVGVLSTGNELLVSTDTWAQQQQQPTSSSLTATATASNNSVLVQTGQIPDVNKPILMALLESFGNCQAIDLGMERDDDKESMTSTLRDALETCDVILTTGGISMGETDIVEDVLVRGFGGTLHFGRLKMKPGKPTTFVTIPSTSPLKKKTLVFALPGNPVSATVCTHLVVRPALDMLAQFREEMSPASAGDTTQAAAQKMVQNALVQPEIIAALTHDINLDMGRPEYHRVTLGMAASGTAGAYEYAVTSTGVQRSSRLMSLRDAQGLLVLPRGTTQQPKVLAGQKFPVLLLQSHHAPVRLKDSLHLQPRSNAKGRTPTKVAITQLSQDPSVYPLMDATDLSRRVQTALTGSRSGSMVVVSCHDFTGLAATIVGEFQKQRGESDKIDLWVVACSGSFSYSLEVSQVLSKSVGKVADALALQARRGAAAQDGTAALFEPVVGYFSPGNPSDGCMLIALPTNGLEGGLNNVRVLLKHALNVARGKPHNEHHKQGHSH